MTLACPEACFVVPVGCLLWLHGHIFFSPEKSFNHVQLTIRNTPITRRPGRSGSYHTLPRRAHLPNHFLHVPRFGTWRQFIRPQGVRQYLYPHYEPDQRRVRAQNSGAGRRRGGAGGRLRTGGTVHCAEQHPTGRRQFHRFVQPLRRHLQSVQSGFQTPRHRSALCSGRAGRRLRAPH